MIEFAANPSPSAMDCGAVLDRAFAASDPHRPAARIPVHLDVFGHSIFNAPLTMKGANRFGH
jgi:hypothetical protein